MVGWPTLAGLPPARVGLAFLFSNRKVILRTIASLVAGHWSLAGFTTGGPDLNRKDGLGAPSLQVCLLLAWVLGFSSPTGKRPFEKLRIRGSPAATHYSSKFLSTYCKIPPCW
jgi:hypothetical protein